MHFSRRPHTGRYTNRLFKRAEIIAVFALVAFTFSATPRKVRPPARNPLVERIAPADTTPVNSQSAVASQRTKTDSLAISYKARRIYICSGPYAECFHLDSLCCGLSNCSRSYRILTEDSIPSNFRPCQICAKDFTFSDSLTLRKSVIVKVR